MNGGGGGGSTLVLATLLIRGSTNLNDVFDNKIVLASTHNHPDGLP